MHLTQALHIAMQMAPEQPATLYRGRIRSYREFGERVARLADGLRRKLGVAKSERVAVLMLNSDRYQEAMLACWWIGAVLNPMNTRWSAAEVAYSLDDCSASVLIVDDHHLPLLKDSFKYAKQLPALVYAGDGETPSGMQPYEQLIEGWTAMKDCRAGSDDLAVIMYTDGTTGRPQKVMLSHHNLWLSVLLRMADLSPVPNMIGLNVAPMFDIAGLAAVYARVVSLASNVYIPSFDALEVLQTISRERVNEVLLVPTMLQLLLHHPQFADFDLGCLKRILYGASPISTALLERALADLPQIDFVHVYGLTENTGLKAVPMACTAWQASRSPASGSRLSTTRGGEFPDLPSVKCWSKGQP